MKRFGEWVPAIVLGIGALFTVGIDTQRSMPLHQPLALAVPVQLEGLTARDVAISDDELRVAGVSNYLFRLYEGHEGDAGGFSLYIGYYERQTQGSTIHSPKNCLPGAGWEPLSSRNETVATADGPVTVNRYLIQNGPRQALVLYWYQGRGRVAANEYVVKWDLLRDAALRQRSEEALVRIVVPVTAGEGEALERATRVAAEIVPALGRALPS